MCGDTPLKWLAKVAMGCAYPFSVSLLCVLPDGKGLGIEDYFAPDKRFYSERIDEEEAAEKSKWLLDLTGDDVSMLVNKDGVKWTWTPYFVLSGCDGSPSVSIKWQELKEFRNDNFRKKTVGCASSTVDADKQKGTQR
jgi:hypothetical protein